MRQLAADLSLAPGTVARAYQLLEAAGLVRTHRGGGTRVQAQPSPTTARRATLIEQRARGYLDDMRRLGATDQEAVDAVTTAVRGDESSTER